MKSDLILRTFILLIGFAVIRDDDYDGDTGYDNDNIDLVGMCQMLAEEFIIIEFEPICLLTIPYLCTFCALCRTSNTSWIFQIHRRRLISLIKPKSHF